MNTYKQIRQLQQQGKIVLALSQCQLALSQQTDNLGLMGLLGSLYCQQQDYIAARKLLERILSRRTEFDTVLHTDVAGIYILLGEPSNALQHLDAALTLDSANLLAIVRRGLVCLQTGYYRQALEDFTVGLQQLPQEQHLGIHINLARCYLNTGKTDRALYHINTAYALGGGKREAWLCVAVDCHIALHNIEAAELALQNSLADGVNELLAVKINALILAAQNRHDEAELLLRTCLQQYPEHLELLTQLASIAMIKGRYGAALAYLQRAIVIDGANPELWIELAWLGRLCLSDEKVREAAETALALTCNTVGQSRADALVIMAQVEADAEQYHLAENFYQQALQELPNYVPASVGLGYLWLQWGRVDAAIALFEAVAACDPLAGYSALSHTKHFPNDPRLLEKIAQVANLPSIQGPVVSSLFFDLAAAWEQRQDFARAFHFAREANSAIRQQSTYDPQPHRDYCVRLTQLFDRTFFAERKAYGNTACLPVFIVGMPRSGTTLVEQLLGGHPDIFVAGEIGLLSTTIQKLNAWEQHLCSGISYPECLLDLTAEQAQQCGEQVLTECRQYHPTVRYIVDKLPHNFENIGLIRLLFPQAKIIHVQRELRDIAVSTYFTHFQAQHAGMGYAYDLRDIAMQLMDYQQLMQHWDDALADPILTLAYEEVVDNTEAAARKMLSYLALEWAASILDHQHRTRAVKTASIWQVRQAVYQSSKQKWRRYADFLEPLEEVLNTPIPEFSIPKTELKPGLLPPGLFFSGMDLLHAKQYAQAAATFERILAQYPSHAAAKHMLGLSLFKLGNLTSARLLLEASVKQHAGHANWYQNLAMLYQQLGRFDDANDAMNKAKQLQLRVGEPSWNESVLPANTDLPHLKTGLIE
ncbi:MAG: sulfotransferase [Methylococcales bacterium]